MPRTTVKHTLSFADRCKALAQTKVTAAMKLAPGPERDSLEREAKELENARGMDGWLASSDLQPPV